MSKHTALAYLLVETARQSFRLNAGHKLLAPEWDDVCSNSDIQEMINHSIRKPTALFQSRKANDPTPDDYEALRNEIRPNLARFERRNEIRALFHEYEAETLMYPGDWEIMSEGFEELVIERLETDFNEHGY